MESGIERGYWCVRFSLPADCVDALLGLLERTLPLGLEERPGALLAYYSAAQPVEDLLRPVAKHIHRLGVRWQIQWVRSENWNARWAASMRPVTVGDAWCIVPTVDPVDDLPHARWTIHICPAMAFGTGHHATTRMMLQALSRLECADKEVLDAGTGSGILAIAAVMMGARSVTAIDQQEEAIDNAQYNAHINGIDGICFVQSDIRTWKPRSAFDIVLANIHRQVVLDFIQQIDGYLRSGGTLICSGYLADERHMIERAAQAVGLRCVRRDREGEWACDTFLRPIKECAR